MADTGKSKREHLQSIVQVSNGLIRPKELTPPEVPEDLKIYLQNYYEIQKYKRDMTEFFTLQDVLNYQEIFDVKFHPLDVQIMKRLDFVYINELNRLKQGK